MRNFATHFWTNFQETREETAFISLSDEGLSQETYWEWTRRVQRLALGLMEAGLKPGTRIGMVAPNSQSWLDLAFAGWLVGACIVPLVPDRDRRETLRCLARSGCDWIVMRDSLARNDLRGQANLPEELRWILLDEDQSNVPGIYTFKGLEEEGRIRLRRGAVSELAKRTYDLKSDLPALILFEPEPGDDPRGAHYSGKKLAQMLELLSQSTALGTPPGTPSGAADGAEKTNAEKNRIAVLMNYGWFPAALFSFAALLSGQTLLIGPNLSEVHSNLKVLKPTHLVCGPAFLEGQARKWLERIEKAPEFIRRLGDSESPAPGSQTRASQTLNRALGVIGERAAQKLLYEPLLDDFGGRLQSIYVFKGQVPDQVFEILDHTSVEVLTFWGLPECGISHIEHSGARQKGSVGRPVEGYVCKIHQARAHEAGEILLRTDVLFDGYWDDEGPRKIEDHWLHTGVQGRIESGFLILNTP